MQAQQQSSTAGELSFARADAATLVVRLAGDWHLRHGLPTSRAVEKQLDSALPKPNKLTFEASGLGEWDSGLLTFLNSVSEICHQRKLDADWSPLPEGVRKLIELAEAVPEKIGGRAEAHHSSFIEHLGSTTLLYLHGIDEFLRFLGEVTLAFMKMFVGKARFRRVDFMVVIQDCGVNAFGIVSLITFRSA